MPDPLLVAFHLHQRAAPLDARERALEAVERLAPAREHVALTSCHRVELYAALALASDPDQWLRARVGEAAALFAIEHEDRDTARHLLRVACGLDSAVPGEAQILLQLRRAHDRARSRVPLEPVLSELVRRALHVGRRVRATTALGRVRRSIGSLAVDEVVRFLPRPHDATVVLVGAGEVGSLAARALAARVGHIVVANRDAVRGAELAGSIGASSVSLDALGDTLADADGLVAAADSRGTILTRELLSVRLARGPLVLVDVAVPRSVAPDARSLPGLAYRSVDDLAASPDASLAAALAGAAERVEDEAARFVAWRREREASAAIRALRERAETVRRARLQRALAKLGHLDARDRRIVEQLSSLLVGELLHRPTVALRRSPERAAVALELFGTERR